ncbi:MAG: hypothetical protein ACE5GO_07030, partial [Anaerolineales bacterium]
PLPPSPTPSPAPTPTLTLPEAPPPDGISETDFTIRYHPDGALYVGDLVSFEIIAPQDVNLDAREVAITVDDTAGSGPGPAGFGRFGIGGRYQATLWWAWDTSGLEAGEHTLTFSITASTSTALSPGLSAGPDSLSWTETVTLLPISDYAFPEPDADWASIEIDCCVVYYITGTETERDLEVLLTLADEQAESAIERIDGEFTEPITVIFLPRLLGHGGFAGSEIYISYLDRNYAGNAPEQVLHHEMVHILDGRLGGNMRPTLFVEGLAVYLTGGHFKQEPLMERAAEVLDLDWYLPLDSLADDFYPAQHEISYLEAAALIEFMIETWGWEAFSDFYRDIHGHPSNLESAAINQALQRHFGLTFAELETQFLEALEALPDDPALEDDVRLTVTFYDTVRRYQQALDTSAYFLTAWLPDGPTMRERGIVADYLRHPAAPENIALETLLVAADENIRAGQYAQAETLLIAANAVLDAYDEGNPQPFYAHPLAADYLAVVLAALEQGYTPQIVRINENLAQVWARLDGVGLVELDIVRGDGGWETQ